MEYILYYRGEIKAHEIIETNRLKVKNQGVIMFSNFVNFSALLPSHKYFTFCLLNVRLSALNCTVTVMPGNCQVTVLVYTQSPQKMPG